MNYCVYILASKRNGTLYIGVTSNLQRRIYQHKNNTIDGFTKKYGVRILVWYECTSDIEPTLAKEKQLKKWERRWKLNLIEKTIPNGGTCTRSYELDSRLRGNDRKRHKRHRGTRKEVEILFTKA